MSARVKSVFLISILLALIPTSLACTAPIFFNEYHVPIPMFGVGLTTINETNYPRVSTIDYNFTVYNANNQSMTVVVSTSDNLKDYFETRNVTLEPNQELNVPFEVNLNGPSVFGKIFVFGVCESGRQSVTGTVNLQLIGRDKKFDSSYMFAGALLAIVTFIIILIFIFVKKKKWGK